MKQHLTIYLITIAAISVVLSDDPICCPEIKEEWCLSECYHCEPKDYDALETEQREFDKFMDILYDFDAVPMKMDIDNCTTGVRVPSYVEFIVDKTNTRDQLYKQFYLKIHACNDCEKNPSPEKFSKCSIRVRKEMGASIKSIIAYIETQLKHLAAPHKKICDKLPIY